MEQSTAAVESDLVDLTGVSLAALRSVDGAALAAPMARLLRRIDDPRGSDSNGGGFNPPHPD